MPNLGTPELIIIFLVVLLLVGGKKLPELARSIGTSMQELRKGMSDDKNKTATTKTAEKAE
ncbi:MAG: Sec-independent protein secretion pathway component [Candidatus Saccharibacteria bacterium]|nr:Sec-independent protein secretion pathway component [Candidatus Saccharibacteria bacterium]